MSKTLEVDHGNQKVCITLPKECFGFDGMVIENGTTQYAKLGIPPNALPQEFTSDFYYSEGNWAVSLEEPTDAPAFVEVSTYGKSPVKVTRRVYIESKSGYSVACDLGGEITPKKENLDGRMCVDILKLVGLV